MYKIIILICAFLLAAAAVYYYAVIYPVYKEMNENDNKDLAEEFEKYFHD